MSLDARQVNTAGTSAEVDSSQNAMVNTPGHTSAGVIRGGGPANAGCVGIQSVVDDGTKTAARLVRSPEVDGDYRLRVAEDTLLDKETFNYNSQNTGKHSHAFTTLTATASTNGVLTNSGAIGTTATGMTFGTFAEFPVGITGQSVYCETQLALNVAAASIPANAVFDVGMYRRGASTGFLGTDGVYFRFTSAGIEGISNNSTTETTTGVLPATGFGANENHIYQIVLTELSVQFFIDNVLYGTINTPSTVAQPCRSMTLPWSIRHANTGTVSSTFQVTVTDYYVALGGPVTSATLAVVGNRTLGSYQGLSGGTMGGLATFANSANPTAAVPSNTSLTANLLAGLGGQLIETDTVAVTTDGILMSYQVPAGSISVQGRRLVVTGIKIDGFVSTALTGGGYNAVFSLAFGHTAVSLATAETGSFVTATAKAPRRIAIGSYTLASGAVALVQAATIQMTFQNPIYVNPGEFIALVKKKVGTAPSAGAIFHTVTLDYGWE